ncbi:putative DnaJ domain, Chaperone J-domain superfamily [Helianthus annuus]|nr:putative DnaJ domain, Chaperone J-domain superfamily [Helianthus annuus]KAJ0462368.1 putative DnaJ domain, Chaperone J-domain superfamily [Helianthus annuus]KAJ0838085.1 putative DnaJ domain, Chaperone J-domain superfamily [Helianthus annuus]
MSYNKVEALREKSDAEKLILSNDYIAARTKLKKAQQLFPSLDHITPMLTVCEILSASTNIIPGYETDYYWVLQLMPSSAFTDITCQYQKLVSLLQPIKYKFPATELALKLLQEAYSVLSDKKKRVAFDIKRGTSWVNYETFESNPEKDSNGEKVNGNTNNINIQESGSGSGSSSSDVISEGYKGQDTDINSGSHEQKQDFYNFDTYRTPECFELRDIWAVHCNLTQPCIGGRYGQVCDKSGGEAEITWLKPIPVTEGERRWFDAGLPVACGSFCLDTEKSGTVGLKGVFSYKCSWDSGITEELYEIYPKKGEVWAVYDNFDLDEWSYNPDIIKECSYKLVEIITDYSIYNGVECGQLVKVNGFKSVYERQTGEGSNLHIGPRDLYMLAHNVPAYRFTGGEIYGVNDGMFELDQLALKNLDDEPNNQPMVEEKDPDLLVLTPNPNPNPQGSVLGPNWAANDFTTGQVWATYSGKDLMPRQYVLINNMISPSGFSATVLEPETVFDVEASWKSRNLPIVCGMFRAKEVKVNLDISQFSHLVNCFKSTSNFIYKIFPTKGEIWAVYRNWKLQWNRVNYDNCKCWVVEILSDFSDGEKMMVARLVEVKGCLTFFQRMQGEDGFEMVRGFSKREMLCFSHRIPAFRVPGIGGHGIPESSWHLEPNALPPNGN